MRVLPIGRLLLAALIVMCTSACSDDRPIKVGFLGGLSGPVSDLGGPSRNAMLLAIEDQNRLGGIHGRQIEALIRDDKQDPAVAQRQVAELLKEEVDVIIGPITSVIATAVVEQVNEAKTLMMGVTVTTDALSGRDDYFVRCLAATETHATAMARFITDELGYQRYTAVIDTGNDSYTRNWISHFREYVEQQGGEELALYEYHSGHHQAMVDIAEQLLPDPGDITILVTNALDAAILAKLLRTQRPGIRLGMAEWAGTERLLELGGRYVEGAIVPQYFDRASTHQAYLNFRDRYIDRFSHAPGFPSIIAYDATNVVLTALEVNPDPKALKQTILNLRDFKGLHGPIRIDDYGDGIGSTVITQIRHGRFHVQDAP